MSRAVELANQVQEMFRQADLEGRVLTAEERQYAQSLVNEAKGLGPLEMSLNEIGRQLGGTGSVAGDGSAWTGRDLFQGYGATLDPGARFISSEAFKSMSMIGLSTKDEQIKKVATFLPLSTELLEDAPAVQTFINQQLLLYINTEAERELLRGNGTNEVQGLLNARGVPVYAGGTAVGNKAEQLFRAMNGVRGSAFVEPDFTILNYQDYQDIRLAKDTQGQLYGGGPFFGPYGNSTPVAASGQVTGVVDYLWGKPAYVTSALGQGTAVVGASARAAVMSRGGASVEMSTSHSNYFQLNLVAVRAERRLGLCVYRPQGFCEVRLS